MHYDKLCINFDAGTISIDNHIVFSITNKTKEFQNPQGFDLKTFKKNKSLITRMDGKFLWEGFLINSLVLKKNNLNHSLQISFEPTTYPIFGVEGHPITLSIEKYLSKFRLNKKSKIEKIYLSDFFSLTIKYDLHMLAISAVIKFNEIL